MQAAQTHVPSPPLPPPPHTHTAARDRIHRRVRGWGHGAARRDGRGCVGGAWRAREGGRCCVHALLCPPAELSGAARAVADLRESSAIAAAAASAAAAAAACVSGACTPEPRCRTPAPPFLQSAAPGEPPPQRRTRAAHAVYLVTVEQTIPHVPGCAAFNTVLRGLRARDAAAATAAATPAPAAAASAAGAGVGGRASTASAAAAPPLPPCTCRGGGDALPVRLRSQLALVDLAQSDDGGAGAEGEAAATAGSAAAPRAGSGSLRGGGGASLAKVRPCLK